MKAESNPDDPPLLWLQKYKRQRRKDLGLSYSCHLYSHKRCKGRNCQCECHKC